MSEESLDDSALAGKNIWVIGINYAPDQVGIAPYTTQMCAYFAERGASVHVTTGIPYYPEYRVDPADRWTVSRREIIEGIQVRRLRHTVPRKMTALRRGFHEMSFLTHVLSRRRPVDPDVIVAVTPALSGAVAASKFAKRLRVPLVVVFQDLTAPGALQSGIAGGARVSEFAGRLEKQVVEAATEVVVLHAAFVDYVRDLGQPEENISVIRNWSYALPPETPRDQVRDKYGWDHDTTVVLYGGNVGLKMGLENVVRAARLAEEDGLPLRFVILGDGNQRPQLEQAGQGISTLQFEDPTYGTGFPDVLAAADILLINERPSMDNMSLPSKLTYYLHSGNPVLAAVPDGGTTAQEVTAAGGGVTVPPGRPDLLLAAALSLAGDPARRKSLGGSGLQYAHENYARDQILAHYERVVVRAMGSSA